MENVLEIEHLSLSLPSKKGMIPILLHWLMPFVQIKSYTISFNFTYLIF